MKHALLALTMVLTGCSSADVSDARKQAQDFMTKIPNAKSVECNDSDSNKDGYVSCTVFRTTGDPIGIQCGAENWCVFNCAHGCRMAIPTTSRSSD